MSQETENKEINPIEMVQKALNEFGKTHSKGELISTIEFLVNIGILPNGYALTIQFGHAPEQKEAQESEDNDK